MTNFQDWKTAADISASEIASRLASIFEDADKAYKQVPGGADLTDINTGHMIERVTQVFGLKGLGWNFTWNPADLVFLGDPATRVAAHLKNAVFSYLLLDEKGEQHWIEIQTSGINQNSMQYAEEGARTSAMGAALKGLCFQLPIYKGYLDHHNAVAVATQVKKQREAKKASEGAASGAGAVEDQAPESAASTAAPAAAATTPAAATSAPRAAASRPAAAAGKSAASASTPAAKAAPTAQAAPAATAEAPTAPEGGYVNVATMDIPERLPDGQDPVKFIDSLADQVNLQAFILPVAGSPQLATIEAAKLRWYAYKMASSNPKGMLVRTLCYRMLQEKGQLTAADKHPLAK